jgi:N-methylhydantoinase A
MPISTDIGGTFTDFVLFDKGVIRTFKVPSTPHKPELAIDNGLSRCSHATTSFSHGTTLATNAVLERKGAKTGLVTTKGFADLLTIGRQQRAHLYKLDSSRPQQIVDKKVCFAISERVSVKGEILTAPSQDEIEAVAEHIHAKGIKSVALCFLFSFLNPKNELIVRDNLVKRGLAVSCSSEVLPEFREYERMSTTVLDAYLKRTVERYLTSMESLLAKTGVEQFYVMQSNGGVVKSRAMKHKPVNMLLSWPAGGVAAAKFLSTLVGMENLITFDMGGTSADASTIIKGKLTGTSEGSINGLPLTMPMVDIVTVGAGGGSIARACSDIGTGARHSKGNRAVCIRRILCLWHLGLRCAIGLQ